MKNKEILSTKTEQAIRIAVASLLATGLVATSQSALAAKGDMEKCYGVVKAGKNDCGGVSNSCAGTTKIDGGKDAWLYLPKGSCEKIVGASLTPATSAQDAKAKK